MAQLSRMTQLPTSHLFPKLRSKRMFFVFILMVLGLAALGPTRVLADSSEFSFDCLTGAPSIQVVAPDLAHPKPRPFGRCSSGVPPQLYDGSSAATSDVLVVSVDCKDKGTPVFQAGGNIECVLDAATDTPDAADVKVSKTIPAARAAAALAANTTPSNGPAGLDISKLPKSGGNGSTELIATGLRVVFGILGAISLVVITLAGFRYVVSRGDPQGINKAKNTILYAVIGLMIAISAQAIVGFVFSRIAP